MSIEELRNFRVEKGLVVIWGSRGNWRGREEGARLLLLLLFWSKLFVFFILVFLKKIWIFGPYSVIRKFSVKSYQKENFGCSLNYTCTVSFFPCFFSPVNLSQLTGKLIKWFFQTFAAFSSFIPIFTFFSLVWLFSHHLTIILIPYLVSFFIVHVSFCVCHEAAYYSHKLYTGNIHIHKIYLFLPILFRWRNIKKRRKKHWQILEMKRKKFLSFKNK